MAKDVPADARIAPELAVQARDRPDQPISVLIEADLPSAATATARGTRPGTRGPAVTVEPLSRDQSRERDRHIAELGADLAKLLGTEPRFFKYSNAFVATVTAEQLQRIAELPLVRIVRPNRRIGR